MMERLSSAAEASVEFGPLHLEVCNDLEGMLALAPAWQGLLDHCSDVSPFLAPAWHLAWWRAFGENRAPHVLAFRDHAQRLVGVVPLIRYRQKIRGLPVRVIGSYNNEHASRTGMVAQPGSEPAIVRAMAEHFSDTGWQWDVLLFRQLPGNAPWVMQFASACRERGLPVFGPTPGTGKCVLPLSGSWDAFLAGKTQHFRKRLKENFRRVDKGGTVVYRRSNGCVEDFDEFLRLERQSWKGEDSDAVLGESGWAFQRDVALNAAAGFSCYNLFLEVDGKVVGGVHVLGMGRTAYSMQTLFDEAVRDLYPGRAQFATQIADLFADERYDLLDLNGNSPFCQSWTETELPFVGLQVYGRQPYSRLLAVLKRVAGRKQ